MMNITARKISTIAVRMSTVVGKISQRAMSQ